MKLEDLALTFVPNLTHQAIGHLLEVFGSAEAIYSSSEAELTTRGALRGDIARMIAAGAGLESARKEVELCERAGIDVISSSESHYPNRMRYTADYPHIIYMVGDDALPNSSLLVAITGERGQISAYGNKMVIKLIEQLADIMPEVVIVGMLDSCVDSLAMRYALNCGLRVVAVTSAPLSQLSAQAGRHLADEILEAGGTLLSEVGVMSAVKDDIYSANERLVAALCDGVVIVESGEISNIARCTESYSRTLMALPGRATDAMSWGANRMIATSMAQMVCSGRDIFKILEEE